MKSFIKPEIELIRFHAEDIITTSADPSKISLDKNDPPTVPGAEDPSQSRDYQNIGWNMTHQ